MERGKFWILNRWIDVKSEGLRCILYTLHKHFKDSHVLCFYHLIFPGFFDYIFIAFFYFLILYHSFMRYISHIIKFTHLKYIVQQVSVYSVLCNHHHYLLSGHLMIPKRNSAHISIHFLSLNNPTPWQLLSVFCLYGFACGRYCTDRILSFFCV